MTPKTRSQILKDAHRRYRRRINMGKELMLTWAEALRRAWAAWRARQAAFA